MARGCKPLGMTTSRRTPPTRGLTACRRCHQLEIREKSSPLVRHQCGSQDAKSAPWQQALERGLGTASKQADVPLGQGTRLPFSGRSPTPTQVWEREPDLQPLSWKLPKQIHVPWNGIRMFDPVAGNWHAAWQRGWTVNLPQGNCRLTWVARRPDTEATQTIAARPQIGPRRGAPLACPPPAGGRADRKPALACPPLLAAGPTVDRPAAWDPAGLPSPTGGRADAIAGSDRPAGLHPALAFACTNV